MGRRVILLLSVMATMVLVAAGVVLSQAPDPSTSQVNVCTGTGGPDVFPGPNFTPQPACSSNSGRDIVAASAGSDTLNGGFGADHLQADTGVDEANGGPSGGDFVNVVDNRANDLASGGPGPNDICAVDAAGEVGTGCEIVRVAGP
jgi:hypothetical protein